MHFAVEFTVRARRTVEHVDQRGYDGGVRQTQAIALFGDEHILAVRIPERKNNPLIPTASIRDSAIDCRARWIADDCKWRHGTRRVGHVENFTELNQSPGLRQAIEAEVGCSVLPVEFETFSVATQNFDASAVVVDVKRIDRPVQMRRRFACRLP